MFEKNAQHFYKYLRTIQCFKLLNKKKGLKNIFLQYKNKCSSSPVERQSFSLIQVFPTHHFRPNERYHRVVERPQIRIETDICK